MAEVTIQVRIEYTGSYSDDGDIAALWTASLANYDTFKIQCEDATDYDVDTGGTSTKNTPKAIKTAASTDKKYGLKFAADNATFNTGYVQNGTVSKVDVSFDVSEISGKSFSTKVCDYFDLSTKVYVGVWGIDNFEQKTDDTYVAKFTPVISHS